MCCFRYQGDVNYDPGCWVWLTNPWVWSLIMPKSREWWLPVVSVIVRSTVEGNMPGMSTFLCFIGRSSIWSDRSWNQLLCKLTPRFLCRSTSAEVGRNTASRCQHIQMLGWFFLILVTTICHFCCEQPNIKVMTAFKVLITIYKQRHISQRDS